MYNVNIVRNTRKKGCSIKYNPTATKIRRMRHIHKKRSGKLAPKVTGSSRGGGITGLFYFLPWVDFGFFDFSTMTVHCFYMKKLFLIYKRRTIGKYIDGTIIIKKKKKAPYQKK